MEGARIGPYRVLGDLGSGGMGKVYLAEVAGNAPGLDDGAKVALKVIHPHLLETPGFFKRFLREAEIGKSVEQDNVVRCFDCDALMVEGRQLNFLVMEYVEGQTLRDLLKELERVPEELCCHIGREIAKGLVAIHEAGAIHRDLKPENVLITDDHVVKVMDLGVARLQDEVVRLSQTGAFVGSLEYAAPEQFRSGGSEVDARSDLHAVGVMLYELSTGQHPYRGHDVSSTLRNVVEGRARRAGEVNPQLSPFFEEMVHTLAAKEPVERFASASDLLAVLDQGELSPWWRGRARTLRADTKRPLRRIRIPRETALYGRDDDLAKLNDLYAKARAGDGQVLLVEGEAGIGKTRLVDEFVGRLRREGEDVNFVFGSYPPGGAATASGAFSEAYREHFGAEGLEETVGDVLQATPLLVPAFAALLRGDAPPTGAEPLTKASLQTVFVHATRGLAAERTTIVLIDDLHFAPDAGRALFASLALAAPGHRILLVGTMRPGVPEAWIANVERHHHAAKRSLRRLGPKDLINLLRDSFRSERLANEVGAQIALKSDGNPFFAFEIIRGLREGQFIKQEADGTWVSTQVIDDIRIPSSVADLVSARIADLGDDERNLLDVAACSGFEFDPSLVGAVLGMARVPTLQAFAKIEARHRLVRSAGRSYVFDHHQVQEALFGALNEQLKEEYHAAIGDTLEARSAAADTDPRDLDGDVCVVLCRHFLAGARGERALRYLDAALARLESAYLNEDVIALADRALEAPNLLQGETRLGVLLRKNGALDLLGRRREQEEVLSEARVLAEASGDRTSRANVERVMGMLLASTNRDEEAVAYFERCISVAREIGDRQIEALAAGPLGTAFWHLGRHEEANTYLERSLAIAREIGDRQGEATATLSIGNLTATVGRHAEAVAQFERSLAISREIGYRRGEAAATGNLGNTLKIFGRYEEARAHHERFRAIAREIGDRQGEAITTGNLGTLFNNLGRIADAKAYLEEFLVISREIDYRRGEAIALVNLGPIWIALGEAERARDALETSLALCREIGARYPEGYAVCSLSRLADEQGDAGRALELAEESLTLRRDLGHEGGVAESLLQLGELRLRAADDGGARDALEEAAHMFSQQQRRAELAHARALLACLPEGDVEAAEAALSAAGENGDGADVRYLLWKVTGDVVHLEAAKRLLDELVAHAPAEYRASMLDSIRLHREIMKAWTKHGNAAE